MGKNDLEFITFLVILRVKCYNSHLFGVRVKSIRTSKVTAFSTVSMCTGLYCPTPSHCAGPWVDTITHISWETNPERGKILPGSVIQSSLHACISIRVLQRHARMSKGIGKSGSLCNCSPGLQQF